jgi:hypothetical protein
MGPGRTRARAASKIATAKTLTAGKEDAFIRNAINVAPASRKKSPP